MIDPMEKGLRCVINETKLDKSIAYSLSILRSKYVFQMFVDDNNIISK